MPMSLFMEKGKDVEQCEQKTDTERKRNFHNFAGTQMSPNFGKIATPRTQAK